MAKTEGILYFKMIVSYGEPTEFDDVGCDGMYIKSVEKTDEVAELRQDLREWLHLARRQYDEMPHNEQLCPMKSGIEKTEKLLG